MNSFGLKGKLLLMIFSLAAVVFLSGYVSAVNIGVSPASLAFKNVLRGGYAEGNLIISADSSQDTNISVTALGNISSWLNFTSNFSVSLNKPYLLKVAVTPPNDTPNGNYTGFLRIETQSPASSIQGNAVGTVRSTLNVYITVQVTDTEILQCSAGKFSVSSADQGDNVVFKMNVTNNGNVIIKPKVIIQIWNEDQTQVVKTLNEMGSQILPTVQGNLSFSVPTGDMAISQYWADVSVVDCLASNLLTFDVLKPGTLKADGILINILTSSGAKTGDTVPIEASFKNTGETEVSAQFKGEVTKSGRIIQLLDSPVSNVAIGDLKVFSFYFTPSSAGDYVISGRVYYSGKQSYEQSTTLNVQPRFSFSFLLPVVYGLLVVLIAFLFLKIIKEKKSYKKMLKRSKK